MIHDRKASAADVVVAMVMIGFAIVLWYDGRPVSPERVQALLARAAGVPGARAAAVAGLKATPQPTNAELASIGRRVDQQLDLAGMKVGSGGSSSSRATNGLSAPVSGPAGTPLNGRSTNSANAFGHGSP